ncbi:MAG TPA: hypothetical protein VFB29_11440 [Pseudolabrys sp.]|nr:hypothetical protein [Pseudolabrys sp.]
MTDREPTRADDRPRVVNFRSRQPPGPATAPSHPAVEDLRKYERGDGADDYRHRMIVNLVAFVFVIGLIAVGLWLADTMAAMRKNQDCVLSGRRGCTPVEVTKDRW